MDGKRITVLLGVLLGAAAALPDSGGSQVLEEGVISQEGTQFITEDPEELQPPPPQPPQEAPPPPPPEPAAVEPPAAQATAAPPRYPAVVILLDTSDSMLNRVPGRPGTLLDQAKAALKQVIAGMSEQTRVQIWVFNTVLNKLKMPRETRSGFVQVGANDSSIRQQLSAAIEKVKTAGGTNLYRAVEKSMAIFGARRDQRAYRSGQRFPVLVVISDGEDSGYTRQTLETVQAAKERFPLVTVNIIGFNVSEEARWFQQLCRIATRPSGCSTAGDQEQLQAILESFYRPPSS